MTTQHNTVTVSYDRAVLYVNGRNYGSVAFENAETLKPAARALRDAGQEVALRRERGTYAVAIPADKDDQ